MHLRVLPREEELGLNPKGKRLRWHMAELRDAAFTKSLVKQSHLRVLCGKWQGVYLATKNCRNHSTVQGLFSPAAVTSGSSNAIAEEMQGDGVMSASAPPA